MFLFSISHSFQMRIKIIYFPTHPNIRVHVHKFDIIKILFLQITTKKSHTKKQNQHTPKPDQCAGKISHFEVMCEWIWLIPSICLSILWIIFQSVTCEKCYIKVWVFLLLCNSKKNQQKRVKLRTSQRKNNIYIALMHVLCCIRCRFLQIGIYKTKNV